MKTSKNNDDRFTSDVLLRQIFQEISNESETSTAKIDDLISKPDTTSPKMSGFLKWIFFIIFVIGISYLWFYTVNEVTQSNDIQIKSEQNTPNITKEIILQKEVTEQPSILKEESKNTHTARETDAIQLTIATSPEIEDPKTERKKAKEALLLQIQK